MDLAGMSAAAPAVPRVSAPRLAIEIARFCRFSVLGFSLLLPLAGAATVSRDVTAAQVAAMLAVALAFHIAGYVSNDVFDLALDRTEPLRAGSPLVRGLVPPRAAFAIAVLPVPLAVLLHRLAGGPPAAASMLLAGMALGLAYNAFGKRIPLPFVSDAIQSLAWIALALYGALTTGAPPTRALLWLVVSLFVYVMMVNGLHGGLRDLANDRRCGAKTTAILLGTRVDDDGRLLLPRRVAVYGVVLHVLMLIAGIAATSNSPIGALLVVLAYAALFVAGRNAVRPTEDRKTMLRAGFVHLFLSIGVVFLPFVFHGNAVVAATMIAVYGAPVLVLALRMRKRPLLPGMILVLAALPLAGQPIRVVPRNEVVAAMAAQKALGYNLLATTNGVRFNSAVLLHLAREAVRNGSTTPFLVAHDDYFEAYVQVTGIARNEAPRFISIAHEFKEDQLVDHRMERVVERIVQGPAPILALNVVAGWKGGAPRYTYEDRASHPALSVTHERVTSHRILDFGDRVHIADIRGISGRTLDGFLARIFSVFGNAQAVQSWLAIASDGLMVTVTTGRKGIFSATPTATVWPDGRAIEDLPPNRPDLAAIERKLRQKFVARYRPLVMRSPAEQRE
jgi:4-hydroxybenzoate polyprenyltransferase